MRPTRRILPRARAARLRRRLGETAAGGERGASVIEYALLIAVILAVCVAGVSALGETTQRSLSRSGDAVSTADG